MWSNTGQACRSFPVLFATCFSSSSTPQHHNPRNLFSVAIFLCEHTEAVDLLMFLAMSTYTVNKSCSPHLLYPSSVPYILEYFLMLISSAILLHFFTCSCLIIVYCLALQSCSEPLCNTSHAALLTHLLHICSLIIGLGGIVIFFTCFPFGATSQISPSLLPSKKIYQC